MTPSPADHFDIDLPTDPGRRREARLALLVAVLLHVVVIGLVLWRGPEFWAPPPSVGAPSIVRAGGGGGGGGGGKQPTLVYILPPATTAPVLVPVPPVIPPPPVKPPPVPEVRAENPSAVAPADTAVATGGAGGPGQGPGTGGGTGGGQGPGRARAPGPARAAVRAARSGHRSGAPARYRSAKRRKRSAAVMSTSRSGWPWMAGWSGSVSSRRSRMGSTGSTSAK